MADWIFDGVNKIIKEPVGTGDTVFNVTQDIYSGWKRWVIAAGAQFDSAFIVEGGTPIGATGLFTGTTFILVNGWKLMPADHDHQCIVIGNIYSSDGIVTTNNPIGNGSIFASGTVGAQGVSTGGALTTQQAQQLADIDILVEELHRLQGLDGANPLTVTPTQRTAGNIDQTISGDGENVTVVTRN